MVCYIISIIVVNVASFMYALCERFKALERAAPYISLILIRLGHVIFWREFGNSLAAMIWIMLDRCLGSS